MANGDFPLASTPAPVPVHVQGPPTVPPSVHSQKKNIVVIGGSFVGEFKLYEPSVFHALLVQASVRWNGNATIA